MKWLKVSSQSGDTIVEVMVVLAVLGLAISISYATANQSLLAARQAQEASQASSLLQSQVELMYRLRQNLAPPDGAADEYIYQAGPYCLDPDPSDPDNVKIMPIVNPGDCVFDIDARDIDSDIDARDIDSSGNGRFKIEIVQEAPLAPAPARNKFKLTATWEDVRGEDTDRSVYNIRIYPT